MDMVTVEKGELKGAAVRPSEIDSVNLAGTMGWEISSAQFDLAVISPTPDKIIWPDGSKLVRRKA